MCTIIITIRCVLWYVMSLAATLMILLAVFSNNWLVGSFSATNFGNKESIMETVVSVGSEIVNGQSIGSILERQIGLFVKCGPIAEGRKKFFDNECIPRPEDIEELFTDPNNAVYPHAWRGAILCFFFGLALMILSDLYALLTFCIRSCMCCSVFTLCAVMQSMACTFFVLGLIAYPAGWDSNFVKNTYCGGTSDMFQLGTCSIGYGYILAIVGTVCTAISSSLAAWAHQSTKTERSYMRREAGDRCICLP